MPRLLLSSCFAILLLLSSFSLMGANGNNNNYLSNKVLNNKTSFFGCENYGAFQHCDRQKNEILGIDIPQKSTQIVNVTREPIYVNGTSGKAINFIDRYGEVVEIPKNNKYESPNFTISFWVKKTNGTSQLNEHAHAISHTSFDRKEGWFFDTNSSRDQSIRFTISNTSGNLSISRGIPISNSSFTQITATFDGSHIAVYKNGNLFEMTNFPGNYNSPLNIPIHIGSASYCISCLQFNGIVDNVQLYNRPISEDEIKQLYFDTINNVTNSKNLLINKGLIGKWTFDNTLNDSSPTKNTAQMFTLIASMVSAPDGRIFVSEKNTGQIKIMKDEELLQRPFIMINDTYIDWEQGLLGLAIDPKFVDNHFVYLYYTAINGNGDPINRVVRFTDKENVGVNMTVILDNLPASHGYHSGGAMAFGPDNKLYITVGDATEHLYSQSLSVPIGKILRINPDGSIPEDNPFPGSPIYTLGHRNMFGIAFDYKDKIGIVTENGDALYDEINLIKKGGNYGFPTLQPANLDPLLSNSTLDIKPLRSYWDTPAPTQAIYYIGDSFPFLKNNFLFGTFNGKIYGVHIDNSTETIDTEFHVKLNHYPFEPTIGMTQTKEGDIFYGSYHIYELNSIFENKSKQTLFPLRFDYSENIVLDNVKASIGKYVSIELNVIRNPTPINSTYEFIKMKIPKSLINAAVGNVTASVIPSTSKTLQNTIPFSLDSNSTQYSYITIPLPLSFDGAKIQIMINSNNSTTPQNKMVF